MERRIYLDNNATTPVDPCVLNTVMASLQEDFGNPSSAHAYGQVVRQKVNEARRQIATILGVRPQEILFTSGGTESVDMVLRGFALRHPNAQILSSTCEHSCVFATLQDLASLGSPVALLSPGAWGAVKPEDLKAMLTPQTGLIALMAANNETGVMTDLDGIAQVASEAGVPLFVDGVALLGKEPFSIPRGVTAMAFSGHKMHAPKGIGFLFLRSSLKIAPWLTGGGQEFGKRGGTENVSGILALAEAMKILDEELPIAYPRMRLLRDRLAQGILHAIPGASINGLGPRLSNTVNISFPGVSGESFLISLDRQGLAVSHGSACASGALEPSRILLSMGLAPELAASSIRFSLSRMTTQEEIDRAIAIVVSVHQSLK